MHDWTLTTDGSVSVLTMTSGENRLSATTLGSWSSALETMEATSPSQALVITGQEQYWSTGLDLDQVDAMSRQRQTTFIQDFDRLLGRLLTAPFVTVAALNGHTYAGGALLALACDYRVMRIDRGYFCLPSVDIGIPFSRGMAALIAAKLPQPAAHDLVISCRRVTAREALSLGAIDRAEEHANVLPVAMELAHAYADKDPKTLATVKRRMYEQASTLLSSPR
ncbi:MAG: enoyl-CoA hydratase-related protein [Acidimicrobiia bacterium]|nr:MAG: enoyl-CoA hydratase-related protein [Acidimicrobiia bacterium]